MEGTTSFCVLENKTRNPDESVVVLMPSPNQLTRQISRNMKDWCRVDGGIPTVTVMPQCSEGYSFGTIEQKELSPGRASASPLLASRPRCRDSPIVDPP
jgi:hypothetical protein